MKTDIKRLAIFDCDGTLIKSPMPDTGRVRYKELTGRDWPHKGWWGRPESLDVDIFDIETVPEVIEAYRRECDGEDTLVVMLTGRMVKLAEHVRKVLDKHELFFDAYHYNTGGTTIQCKLSTMNELLEEYPLVESVILFDDRKEHFETFKAWGEKLSGIEFTLVEIDSDNHK